MHRAARVAAPTYALSALRSGGPVVSPEKPAGASVPYCMGGRSRHLRPPCMRSGSFDAVTILGADSPVCWSATDGRPIAPARCTRAAWHMFRRCRTLRADHPRMGSPRAGRPHRRPRAPRSAGCPRDHRAGPRRGCLLARLGRLRHGARFAGGPSPGISWLCSPSCGPPTSTRRRAARSSQDLWRESSSRVWSAPRVNAMSTSTTSSPRCCGRRGRWSPRLFASRRVGSPARRKTPCSVRQVGWPHTTEAWPASQRRQGRRSGIQREDSAGCEDKAAPSHTIVDDLGDQRRGHGRCRSTRMCWAGTI